MLTGKRILITGGTGSLGSTLVRRLLSGELGVPDSVIVFSRDEAKQHAMQVAYQQKAQAGDASLISDWKCILRFVIGDIADESAVRSVLQGVHVVFNAAALKQVPSCEYFPFQAVRTNVIGPENIVRTIRQNQLPVETVIAISTDKACKPVNVMGMTKALQERIVVEANLYSPGTRFVASRYGNVLASRGSVIPLFLEQVARGGPVTITTPEMTRFLMNLNKAVETIFAALRSALPGEIYIPRVPSARITDVADAIIGSRPIKTVVTGIRPGEKVHEILVSEEEAPRTIIRGQYLVIRPMLPELLNGRAPEEPWPQREYSSADATMTTPEVEMLLEQNGLLEPRVSLAI